MDWKESEWYGNTYDGTFVIYSNHPDGWKKGKEQGGDLNCLGFQYKHNDGEGGATYITLEEAKDLHKKIGEYIDFMEFDEGD